MKLFNGFQSILIRYALLLVSAFPNFWIFYLIFTPLTIYPIYFLLNIFFDVSLIGRTLIIGDLSIKFINACIAGSAYYLLLVFNLSIPNVVFSKLIKMIVFSFVSFLIVNLIRIFVLSLLAISGSSYFSITHAIFWHLISTVFVVAVWFAEVKLFKIKTIPFYSDIKFIYNKSSLKKV